MGFKKILLSIQNPGTLIQLIGFLFFGFLFFMAWHFFKERMLIYDPAFFSFRIIHEKNFDIELHRWGSVLSQIIPLLLLKQGCSLEIFLKSYSISFVIIYYLIFLSITIVLKNNHAGIAMMISLCITFRHAFYYPTGELYVGIALCSLLWAFIIKVKESGVKKNKVIFSILSLCLIYVISYFHQLTLLCVIFIFVLEILLGEGKNNRWLLSLLLITLAWLFIRITFLTTSEYETGKIPSLSIFIEYLPRIKNLPSYLYLKQFFRTYLFSFFILILISLIAILKKRKWLLAVFIPAFISGFIILIIITFYNGESPVMYENYITLLGLIAGVLLIRAFENMANSKIFLFLLIILLAFNLRAIYKCHVPFSNHIAYLKRLTETGHRYSEKKYLIEQSNFPWSYGWVDWTLPFETLLYSSLKGADSSITVYSAKSINQYDSLIKNKNVFLGPEWSISWFSSNILNSNYFKLPSSGYRKLSSLQSDTSFNESVFNNNNVSLSFESEVFTIPRYSSISIPVRIINHSDYTIHSIPDIQKNVQLCYHLNDINGKLLFWDGIRTPLEMDVEKESTQAVNIDTKLLPGEYLIDVDFLTENKRWWGINSRFKLIVK